MVNSGGTSPGCEGDKNQNVGGWSGDRDVGARTLSPTHLAQIQRILAALFRPQLDGEKLRKTHKSLFQGDLGRAALRSASRPILRLRAACEAR